MHQPVHHEITVPQVFIALGVEPRKDWTWAVGKRCEQAYAAEMGQQPPKDNRPKTNGPGSHCFALYPRGWYDRIAKMVHELAAEQGRQNPLFPTDDT